MSEARKALPSDYQEYDNRWRSRLDRQQTRENAIKEENIIFSVLSAIGTLCSSDL
jgi:hypothetical protein